MLVISLQGFFYKKLQTARRKGGTPLDKTNESLYNDEVVCWNGMPRRQGEEENTVRIKIQKGGEKSDYFGH